MPMLSLGSKSACHRKSKAQNKKSNPHCLFEGTERMLEKEDRTGSLSRVIHSRLLYAVQVVLAPALMQTENPELSAEDRDALIALDREKRGAG